MTWENIQKQYKYFCKLAKGEFNERDFDRVSGTNDKFEGGSEEGITLQGKMTVQRVELIKSNALRNKKDIEKKFPQIIEPVTVPPTKKTTDKTTDKSKGKE